jgi:hypothetical protein
MENFILNSKPSENEDLEIATNRNSQITIYNNEIRELIKPES